MKTKIVKKLISIVCAATMATSCVSMSVGAVPQDEQTTIAVYWKEELKMAEELLKSARELYFDGVPLEGCEALADGIDRFSDRFAYLVLVGDGLYAPELWPILSGLRSDDLDERLNGQEFAVRHLSEIVTMVKAEITSLNM